MITYLPVSRRVNEKWNKNMHWHNPGEYFYYPHLLVTPFVTGMNSTREQFGDHYKDLHIVADSGGYQIATQDLPISNIDVLRWQEGIADVAFTLDTPPYSYKSNVPGCNTYPKPFFEKCLKQSVEEANKMYAQQRNEKMQLWAVLQGKDSEEIMKWYEAQTKEHEFDGYCVAVTAAVNMTTEGFSWLDQLEVAHKIDRPFHWLGRCEPLIVILLSKLSKVTGHDYTYDTSSTIVGSRFGKYYDPYHHNLLWLSKEEDNRPDIDTLPCDCPICSRHTIEDISNTKNPHLMVLHNLYCRKRFNDYVDAMVKDDDIFLQLVNRVLLGTRLFKKRRVDLMSKIMKIIYNEDIKQKKLNNFGESKYEIPEGY